VGGLIEEAVRYQAASGKRQTTQWRTTGCRTRSMIPFTKPINSQPHIAKALSSNDTHFPLSSSLSPFCARPRDPGARQSEPAFCESSSAFSFPTPESTCALTSPHLDSTSYTNTEITMADVDMTDAPSTSSAPVKKVANKAKPGEGGDGKKRFEVKKVRYIARVRGTQ
jgi:hypothetical protein